MILWGDEKSASNSVEDAKKICNQLNIKHYVLDFRDEFKEKVIDNFADEYRNGRTPNPCIQCNKYLKFGKMYEKAQELGCEYIATGHYAKTEFDKKWDRYVIKKSKSEKKDQSYVLYRVPKELISKIIFPLSDFESKDEIRKIAMENKLDVANKPDSEDICFIPDGDYKKFLEENSNFKPKEGNIVLENGKIVGKHQGLYRYTIGQRKGLKIANSVPLFVLGFNHKKNELIVGEEERLYKKEMIVGDLALLLIDDLSKPIKVNVKTRYSSKEAKAIIQKENNEKIKVIFDESQARITPGQSAVFYIDDILFGGGIIEGEKNGI